MINESNLFKISHIYLLIKTLKKFSIYIIKAKYGDFINNYSLKNKNYIILIQYFYDNI